MKKWIVIARYFYGNSYTINRYVYANSRKEAYNKAKKRLPEQWQGWSLQEIMVQTGNSVSENVLKNALKHHLDEPIKTFKKTKIQYDPLPKNLSRKQRAKHITGKTV